MPPESWELWLGAEILGILTEPSIEFPWTYCHFEKTQLFDKYAIYFTDPEDWEETEEMGALLDEINTKGKPRLMSRITKLENYHPLTINFDGETAWFRSSCMVAE